MPIDKRTPRVLNSDADNKTIDKVSMQDALNLYSGPDNEGFGPGGNKSDAGDQVLKNIKGNLKVNVINELPNNARLIGSVEDSKIDVTYLFIYSTDASGHGIWAYDRYGKLPGSQPNSLRLIYKSKQFNFPQNGFVKADIVYSNAIQTWESLGSDFDKDTIIYFTDGENEPRKINAYRALQFGSNIHGDNTYAEADFITACPKTPLKPIKFSFGFDESRSTSNFTTIPGFQFAYQYVYKDGMESSISPYSDVAYPPSVIFQGKESFVDHNNYNVCNLSIPLPNPIASNEIASIKLLAKQGVDGKFLIVDEFNYGDESIAPFIQIVPGGAIISYPFYNDRIGTGVSDNEVNKQFDSVPRKAVTQSVSSNRLMYGNYLDGFNAIKTNCTAEVIYKEAPESFLSYDVKVNPSIEPIGAVNSQNYGKSVGFVLDFSGVPSSIPAGTKISINLVIAPDRNWHIYSFKNNADGTNPVSFHQTRQLGIQTQGAIDDGYNGVNYQQSFAETDAQAGVLSLGNVAKYFGNNNGVGSPSNTWKKVDTTNASNPSQETVSAVSYGTSAANPLILKGGTISFSATIEALSDIEFETRSKVNQSFRKALTTSNPDLSEFGFQLVSQNIDSSYSLDVGLYSGKLIKQSRIKSESQTDSESRLIVGVNFLQGTEATSDYDTVAIPPGGYFIVNKAKPKFKLHEVSDDHYLTQSSSFTEVSSHIRIGLQSINDVELYTCLHSTTGSNQVEHNLDWIAISKADLQNEVLQNGISSWLQGKGINPSLEFHLNPLGILSSVIANQTYEKQIGLLNFANSGSSFFSTSDEFCVMDGEGGPGGGPSHSFSNDDNRYDSYRLYNQGSVTVNPYLSGTTFAYDKTVFYSGKIGPFGDVEGDISNHPYATVLPLLFKISEGGGNDNYSYILPEPSDENSDVINTAKPNFKRIQSPAEIISESFNISNFDQSESRSFKTEANHDFGIVYYDERGRHGFVNPLTSVFVQGYSDAERPGQGGKGRVEIKLVLNHQPPSWAHHYKIVYSKNTTVADFIQYSAGGAFVAQNLEEQEIAESNQNIYISLNYLQGHFLSYVSSFGARTPEGGLNFYKFQEGDKLRVISYFEGETRKYVSYDFDVANFVKLGHEDNPIAFQPTDNQTGDFVVIKNNPAAFGFTHGETLAGTSKWGDNCIIELRTPLKDLDADQRVFYEMSETYDVVFDANGNIVHDQPELILKNGDVWFRPVATNVREFENGQYVDLIFDADPNDPKPKPNFKNVFLESPTATDLFRADNLGLGRPNFVLKNAKETVREATITYSEPSNPEGKRLNYSSFNASLANFKDLPERFGGIQYMSDYDEFMFVLQQDKVCVVPVNKSILSDASGNNMVIASTNILGKAVFYPGQNGCDSDPSSVFDSGQEVYFCNKALSKIYRWTKQQGIEDISDKGMSSMIRATIQRAISEEGQFRLVGGYDPLKEEYLFTITKPQQRSTINVEYVLQPSQIIQPGGDDEEDDDDVEVLSPTIDVSSEEIIFDSVESGGAGSTSDITIYNEGTADLHVTGVTFDNSNIFSVRNFSAFYVSPNQSGNIQITLDAAASAGTYTSNMTIISNAGDLIVALTATITEPVTVVELNEFTQAWNNFYSEYTSLAPAEYPLISDEQMSAELAINYLKDLGSAPEDQHPTVTQIADMINYFPLGTRLRFDYNNDGNIGTADLINILAFYNSPNHDINASVFSAPPTEISTSAAQSIFDEIPDVGGEMPIPTIDPPSVTPDGVSFSSTSEAINYIIGRADMTVAQFNLFNTYVKPRVKCDFDGDGIVGTNDLLDVLQYYGFNTPLGSELAFINANTDSITNPLGGITTSQALMWLIGYSGGGPTAGEYWNLASYIRLDVRTDVNGDYLVGQNDHLSVISNWSVETSETPATPYDSNELAFALNF